MILRPALPADVPALADLGVRSFVAKFGPLYTPENLAAFLTHAHTHEEVAGHVADPAMRVMLAVCDDGALLGYCKVRLLPGWPGHARGQRPVEVKQLYTDPAATGQGIGRQLMDWAMGEAASHNADEVQLSVFSENFGAQRFYARYGFEKVTEIHFMVGDQADEDWLYSRLL